MRSNGHSKTGRKRKNGRSSASTATNGALTDKEAVFCQEYLVDLNATQAATRAGYSGTTAGEIGYELLQRDRVQTGIRKLFAERSERTRVTADRVVAELARVAFVDADKIYSWGPRGVTVHDSAGLSEDDRRAVAECSETVTQFGGTIRVKLHDKTKALELLGRHLGLFTDKVQVTGKDGQPLIPIDTIRRALANAGYSDAA